MSAVAIVPQNNNSLLSIVPSLGDGPDFKTWAIMYVLVTEVMTVAQSLVRKARMGRCVAAVVGATAW